MMNPGASKYLQYSNLPPQRSSMLHQQHYMQGPTYDNIGMTAPPMTTRGFDFG